MTVIERKQNRVAASIPALFWVALGIALIASSLAVWRPAETPAPVALNRTVEALEGFEDLAPPADARTSSVWR